MIADKFLFPNISTNHTSSIDAFIEQWSSLYDYKNTHIYDEIIPKHEFTADDVINLFRWKNAMPLSSMKISLLKKKICNRINDINQLKREWNQSLFEKYFISVGSIWRIFLMHIINPDELPIFDQHVYRAYKYLAEHEKYGKFKAGNNLKMELYFQKYVPFHLNMKENMSSKFSNKQLDAALWAFGKFLSKYDKLML